jgi:glycerol-3-phosphate acyltransferase PlsY
MGEWAVTLEAWGLQSLSALGAGGLGYVVGSLPFGYWLTRWTDSTLDVRTVGSQSTGATNVWRTAGKRVALLTLLLDIAKGFLPCVFLGKSSPFLGMIAGLGAVLGHVFTLFLGFKGGKGIATALGVFCAFSLPFASLLLALWALILAFTRRVSVASLTTALFAPTFLVLRGASGEAAAAGLLGILLLWTHRQNVSRLLSGTEPRLGRNQGGF